MSADVDLDTVGSDTLLLLLCGLLVIYVLITVSGLYLNSTSEADQRPCRWSRYSCSWESYGGFPRRNSKGPEPRGCSEFTTYF